MDSKKRLFTAEQITNELSLQGIQSIKGMRGCELLYLTVWRDYENAKTEISESVFLDCGINLSNFRGNHISLGEFYLIPSFPSRFLGLSSRKLEIKLNPTMARFL